MDSHFISKESFSSLERFEIAGMDVPYGASIVSRVSLISGEVVAQVHEFEVLDTPSWTSVQIDVKRHADNIGFGAYLNHSCSPNVFFDVELMTVIALRDIAKGEALTFFYPSTEWEMAQAFDCWCGSLNCLKKIAGAAQISADVLKQYRLSPHITELARLR